MWRLIPFLIVGMTALLATSGCRSNSPKAVPESSRNLKAIDAAYKQAMENLRRAPANLQELLPELKEGSEPQEILRSPSDGQDYVILWGTDPYANPALVLAYEKTGKDGKRRVLRGGKVMALSDEELKNAPFPPGYKAPF